MAMKLAELLKRVPLCEGELCATDGGSIRDLREAAEQIEVTEVRDDSRQVLPGDLFVAVRGLAVDGHAFLPVALERGAVAAIVETVQPEVPLRQFPVRNAAQALSLIAAERFGRPEEALSLVGITGTNGKTTTSFLVESLLDEAGLAPGLVGTVTYRGPGVRQAAPFTTPTPLLLHNTLSTLREHGCKAVAMEVSSHALFLDRLFGVRFRVAAFSNLSQDHLDLHGTLEAYFEAKRRLFFDHLLPADVGGRAVVNVDDAHGQTLYDALAKEQRVGVSLCRRAEVSLLSETSGVHGTEASFKTPVGDVRIVSPLVGRFNLENLALAAGIGVALGLPVEVIERGLSRVSGVPGRLERVPSACGPTVFVDYAHTPDALSRVLSTLRTVVLAEAARGTEQAARRLFAVFGCGGDRDTGKRALMGEAAAALADVVVVTSDNPRRERPEDIIASVVSGVTKTRRLSQLSDSAALAHEKAGFFVEPDRRKAIRAAICAATPFDVVLLAGKGHEDYQVLGTEKIHFDDREEAKQALFSRTAEPEAAGTHSASGDSIDLPLSRVLEATGGRLVANGPDRFSFVTIDSRTIGNRKGGLFVAVVGQTLDGHAFVKSAVEHGCAGVLLQRGRPCEWPKDLPVSVVEVEDTVVALGELGRAHRNAPEIAANLKVVAVTGSSGKTSTKDLLAAIFARHAGDKRAVAHTVGNLNNHLGVPLTLLSLRPGQRYAVVEMGMSARGEIAFLASLACPDVGVITNVGPAHLESLGSLENIAAAKGELFAGLADGKTAVFLRGQTLVERQAELAGAGTGRLRVAVGSAGKPNGQHADVYTWSCEPTAQGMFLGVSFRAEHPVWTVRLPLIGAHQAENAAVAAAAAVALGVPAQTIVDGLAEVAPAKHRGQLVKWAGRTIVDDCYNANPASMAAALRMLADVRAAAGKGSAVAVLGDMLELGPTEATLHEDIGRLVAELKLSKLIALGDRARHLVEAARAAGVDAVHVATPKEAASVLCSATKPGDVVLLKGSRGMALERVLAFLPAQCS